MMMKVNGKWNTLWMHFTPCHELSKSAISTLIKYIIPTKNIINEH
jgi:hypothetical protein